MTEHKHHWRLLEHANKTLVSEYKIHCDVIDEDGECDAVLTWEEVLERLNATEKLSAEHASYAAEWPAQVFDFDTQMALKAYARILEGECDPASIGS